jgi:ATP/ADP translocase
MLQAAAMVTGAIVLLTGVAIFLPGTFDPVRGVIQRVQLISELLVLALLIQLSVRCAQHGRRH